MAQDVVSVNVPWALEKNVLFCYCWVECSIYSNQIMLVNGVVEFFYILADYLFGNSFSC